MNRKMENFYIFFGVGIFNNFRNEDLNSYFGAFKQNRSNSLLNISRFELGKNFASSFKQNLFSELN